MSESGPAVNAVGSFTANNGISEAARRAVRALVRAGVSVAVDDRYNGAPGGRGLDSELDGLPTGRPYPIDMYFLNLNEDIEVLAGPPDRSRRAVGFWAWELPTLPAAFAMRFGLVDEVWVGSAFTQQVLASYTEVPVTVMPHIVDPAPGGIFRRESLGLAGDAFVFLFNFDANSAFARKNPLGVIEAFRRAFGESDRREKVRLVVKSINLFAGSQAHTVILRALDEVNGVFVLDDLSAGDMSALVAGCDAYVSMHRAEGFGLGMAEAMYHGRPVVATAYSGNMDFTLDDSACLVGYRPSRIADADWSLDFYAGAYTDSAAVWADPDLDQAAAWMRLLVDEPHFRDRIAHTGRNLVRSRYTERAAGQAMAARLSAIDTRA